MANGRADVLLVTATRTESKAVFAAFAAACGRGAEPVSIGDRVYFDLGQVEGARVFLVQSEMGSGGLGASAQTVQKGIEALAPAAVVMVGIAFGVNDEKQAVGDVLVTTGLRLYDLQRAGTRDGALDIVLRDDRPHASPWLVNQLRSAELTWARAAVRFGVLLTGGVLVDNLDFRDQLRAFEREAIGGEMEGAGLYVACQDRKVDWILVKAICDWADGGKAVDKAARQQVAADNAAAFVLHALGFVKVDWEGRRARFGPVAAQTTPPSAAPSIAAPAATVVAPALVTAATTTPADPSLLGPTPPAKPGAVMTTARYELFLAHPSSDKPSALVLYDRLHPDVRVFLDARSLRPGDRWDRAIPAAQRASRATVVLVSARADAAWYLGDEVATAIALHRAAPDAHAVIPILLEPGASAPYGLGTVQAIDAVAEGGLAGVAGRLREIADRLRGEARALPRVAALPALDDRRDHRVLHKRLLDAEAMFDMVLFHADLDLALPGAGHALFAARALRVAQLARSDSDLCRRLHALLDEHAPWTR